MSRRYFPEPGEVVATARYSGEHVFTRNGIEVGVTLRAHRPTLLPTSVALALAPDGVEITSKAQGEMWRRMRLITRDRSKRKENA